MQTKFTLVIYFCTLVYQRETHFTVLTCSDLSDYIILQLHYSFVHFFTQCVYSVCVHQLLSDFQKCSVLKALPTQSFTFIVHKIH